MHIDDAAVEKHLAAWACDRAQNAERTDAYIDGIAKGNLNLNDIIREMVNGKCLLDAAAILAAILDLDRYHAFNLAGGKIHSALLLLRAAGLSWQVTDAFIQLRIAKAGLYDYETRPERKDYIAIDAESAKRAVRFMKVRRVTKIRLTRHSTAGVVAARDEEPDQRAQGRQRHQINPAIAAAVPDPVAGPHQEYRDRQNAEGGGP